MADVLNRTTLQYPQSVNTPNYPESDWIINPDLSQVEGYESKYWVLNGDSILLMTQAERDAVDASELMMKELTEKSMAKEAVDAVSNPSTRVLIGMAKIIQSELQTNKAAIQQIADHLGLTLTNPPLPSRTIDELREALKGLIENG